MKNNRTALKKLFAIPKLILGSDADEAILKSAKTLDSRDVANMHMHDAQSFLSICQSLGFSKLNIDDCQTIHQKHALVVEIYDFLLKNKQ